MSDYYQKYLKYKNKYLALKASVGGGYGYCRSGKKVSYKYKDSLGIEKWGEKICDCLFYTRQLAEKNMCTCGHIFNQHAKIQFSKSKK